MPGVNCRMFRSQIIESARGVTSDAALRAHLAVCGDCAREFEEQAALTAALHTLVDVEPPPAEILESRLLREFDKVGIARRRHNVMRWMPLAAALLIAAILAGRVLIHSRVPAPQGSVTAREVPPAAPAPPSQLVASVHPPSAPQRRPRIVKHAPRSAAAAPLAKAQPSEPFVAIPYTVPLAPGERSEVLRMDLPVAAMIAAGLPLEVADYGARAQADVLVGQDGRARAIRLLSISTVE